KRWSVGVVLALAIVTLVTSVLAVSGVRRHEVNAGKTVGSGLAPEAEPTDGPALAPKPAIVSAPSVASAAPRAAPTVPSGPRAPSSPTRASASQTTAAPGTASTTPALPRVDPFDIRR